MSVSNDDGERRRKEFLDLYRLVDKDLMKLSRRLCLGNEDRAQDLVQDAVVKAYVASSEGRLDPTTARPWFMRILTNLFINDYRRRKKWESDADVDILTDTGFFGPDQPHGDKWDVPGVQLLACTLDEDLELALGRLSEPLRLTVTLVDMQGLEYGEAAEILGLPIGTVRSRLARARMQLQDLLQDFAKRRGLYPRNDGNKK
jgi:RNA polymerase sigma-70 factor (ECF subfamily)